MKKKLTVLSLILVFISSLFISCVSEQDVKDIAKEEFKEEFKTMGDSLKKEIKKETHASVMLQVTDTLDPVFELFERLEPLVDSLKAKVDKTDPLYEDVKKLEAYFKKLKKTQQNNEQTFKQQQDSIKNATLIRFCKTDIDRADELFEAGSYEKALSLYQKVTATCNAPHADARIKEIEGIFNVKAEKEKLLQVEKSRQDSIQKAKEERKIRIFKRSKTSKTTGHEIPKELLNGEENKEVKEVNEE